MICTVYICRQNVGVHLVVPNPPIRLCSFPQFVYLEPFPDWTWTALAGNQAYLQPFHRVHECHREPAECRATAA